MNLLKTKTFLKKQFLFGCSDLSFAIFRVCFYSLTLFIVVWRESYFLKFAEYDDGSYCQGYMGAWLDIVLSTSQMEWVLILLKCSLIFSIIGFLTPVFSLVSFFLFYCVQLFALRSCYFNHEFVPLTALLFLWTLFNTTSQYSVDAWLFKIKSDNSDDMRGRQVLALQIYFVIAFFLSAVTKLRVSGLEWIFSDSLRNMIIMQNHFYEYSTGHKLFGKFSRYITDIPLISQILAFTTIFFELVAPLALFRRFSKFIVFELLAMQIGVFCIMYINFFAWAPLYLCWFIPVQFSLKSNKP